MASRSLGALTLDLLLKTGGFVAGLDAAEAATKRTTDRLKADAAKLAASLRTPLEQYRDQIRAIGAMKIAAPQVITPTVQKRAVAEAKAAYDALNPKIIEHNRLMAEGARVTAANLTPQQRLNNEIAEYNRLLKAGAISQNTFNRAKTQAQVAARGGGGGIGGAFGGRVFGAVAATAVGAVAGAISVQSIKRVVDIADEYARLENRLRLVTSSSSELARVQESLFDIAQRSRIEYAGVADLYSKLALTGKDLGVSQAQLLTFTEAVGNALTVSGTSAQTARGALTQLAQGLAAGTFRAEEFNAVLEGSPQLIRIVAQNIDRFKGNVGALRLAVANSELGSREFFDAIIKGSAELKKQIAALPITVGQAFTQLQNEFKKSVSEANLGPLTESVIKFKDSIADPAFQEGIVRLIDVLFRLSAAAFDAAAAIGEFLGKLSDARRGVTTLPGVAQAAEVFETLGDALAHAGQGMALFVQELRTLPGVGQLLIILDLVNALAARGAEARLLEQNMRKLTSSGPQFQRYVRGAQVKPLDTPGKADKEAENAREAILKQIAALEQQQATLGKTTEEVIRYRLAHGDLADLFKKAGPAFEKYKEQFVELTLAIEKGQAAEKVKEATKALEAQMVEIQANRIAQTEGAAAAAAYRLEHGELAETFRLAGESIEEYRQRQKDLIAEQATDQITAVITDLEEQIQAIELLRIEQEQGAEAAIRYRATQGDLALAFKDSGQSLEEFVAEYVRLKDQLDEVTRATEAQAASEQYIPDAMKAAEQYALVVEGLTARLVAGTIEQEAFNKAVKQADKDFKEATQAVSDFTVFMEEAQRASQQSLAEYFYDPLREGLDGMVLGFADAVRKIAANIVAAKLAEKLFEGMEEQIDKVGGGIFSGAGGGLGGIMDKITGLFGRGAAPAVAAVPTGVIDPGLGASVAPLLTASTTLTAGATTLTTAATVLTTGSTTLTTAATALLSAAAALSGAAAALAASSAASSMGSGLEEILVTARRVPAATGGPISGPGTGTSDSIPAWLSHGEYVLRAASVQQPGAQAFLNEFNRVGMQALQGVAALRYLPRMSRPLTRVPQRFAAGGIVGGASAKAVAKSPLVIQQSVTINSPNGQVSRQTELQITAAAARGVKVADRRNN